MTSRLGALAAGVLALAAVACGGGNSNDSSPATTGGRTTVATPTTSTAPATTRPATTAPGTTAASATTVSVTTRPSVNLRTVDWLATLRGINLLKVDTTTVDASDRRPFVSVPSVPGLAGYALLDGVGYGDISGDGAEEAVIALFSGGTAGNTGVLVFNVGASGKVELTGPLDFYKTFGYKTGGVIHNGALAVTNVVAAGWEPNCCQSGLVTRTFKIANGVLAAQGQPSEDGVPEARSLTIVRFYELINAKQLDEAYGYLSAAYQVANPIATWKAGFATTKSTVATSEATAVDGPVKFKLDTVDSSPSGDVKRTFTGTWSLVYSTTKHQWLLDRAQVQPGG